MRKNEIHNIFEVSPSLIILWKFDKQIKNAYLEENVSQYCTEITKPSPNTYRLTVGLI